MKDNPNPIANIGFICFVPFHYFVYKNIYKHLQNAEFIIGDYYGDLSKEKEEKRITELGQFLQKQRVYWRYIDPTETSTKQEAYQKYGVLVSCLYKGSIQDSYTERIKKVRVLYGNAKDPWNFGIWNAFFDLILTYGTYSQKQLSKYGNAKIIGNPKFDEIDNKEIKSKLNNVMQIDKKKKTILFLPTYGVLSSQKELLPFLKGMLHTYNIITKFHHNSFLYEDELINTYKKTKIIVKSDKDDIIPLLQSADIVISDNSGAIFDALYMNVSMLTVDKTGLVSVDSSHMYYDENKSFLGVSTDSESLEQKIKKTQLSIGPVLFLDSKFLSNAEDKQIQKFSELITETLKDKKFLPTREKLKNELFSKDKNSGLHAANMILDLLYNSVQKHNQLTLSIRNYIEVMKTREKKLLWQHEEKVIFLFYNKIRSLNFFKRILFVITEFF